MDTLAPRHGARLQKHGTPLQTHLHTQAQQEAVTQFSLWAPDADAVAVKLDNGQLHDLQPLADGWFSRLVPCGAGTGYQFVINDHLKVPDPVSHAQLDDVLGMSCVVDHTSYVWQTRDWRGRPWHEAIIYEVHVGLLGGFAEAEVILPHLAELGITAIELMPLNEFPGARNWGYDGAEIFAPESSYGTPDELKHLIDTAHSLGLMVIIDVVYNHFGPEGNFLGQYAKGFFREDIQTPWGAAIDFRRREVRDFFCENALMWLEDYRADGLRLDAVHAISEKDFLVELAERVSSAIPSNRHIHLILENEANNASLLEQGFTAQWNDDGHNILHHLLTGEKEGYYSEFMESPTTKLARFLREGFIFQGEASRHGHARGEPSGHLPPTAFVLFLQNHDQVGNRAFGERLIALTDEDSLKVAVILLLLSPMVPLLFMGEEWGTRQPFFYFTDHHDELAKAVCEGRRNEFREFELFSHPEMREKIPDPNDPQTYVNSMIDYRERHEPGHEAWWHFYHTLLELRHRWIIPYLPDTRVEKVTVLAERSVSATWRLGNGSQLRIDINLADNPVKLESPPGPRRQLFSHRVDNDHWHEGILPSRSAMVSLD